MPLRNCNYCNILFNAPQRDVNRGNGRFCSRKCSDLNRKSLPSKAKIIEYECAYCKSLVVKKLSNVSHSKSGLHFCDRQCKEAAQSIHLGNMRAVQPTHYNTANGKNTYRKLAFDQLSNKCNRCGYCKCLGILKVHHKDRNRRNNKISNLEILCPTCHDLDHYLNHDGPYSRSRKGSLKDLKETTTPSSS